MMSYTVIPHTADVRLQILADTLPELFLAGVIGMSRIAKKDFCTGKKTASLKHNISITARDTTSLLIDFLSEVLTRSHVEKAIFCKATITKLSRTALRAVIFGARVHSFDEDIKAVTYHDAEIRKNDKGRYETTVIFDI